LQIKVFKAHTSKEAMAMVKAELGIDAVILHIKRYKKGGFFGYKGKDMVEVTAAVEDKTPVKKVKKLSVEKTMAKPMVPRNVLSQYKTSGTPQAVVLNSPVLADAAGLPRVTEGLVQKKPRIIKADDQMMQAFDKEQQGSQEGKISKLQHELDQMKIMLAKVMTKDAEKTEYTSLQEALVQQEVDTQVIQDIIRQTQPDIIFSDKKSPAVKEALVSYLENAVDLSAGIKLEPNKTKIVALIGATGVGKTTTLAKIAAKFVLEQGVSAALITADTYRISAVEQLKTYSDIIGLPIEIVYSPGELKQAIDKHRDKQLILIDTAGRSQHNDYQIQELKELLSVEPEVEKHLVMSATTKYRDAKDILRNFAVCEPNRILFTKIDETSSLGLIVNLLFGHSTVLSYLTDGQSVPDDIFPAETHKLADLLLR